MKKLKSQGWNFFTKVSAFFILLIIIFATGCSTLPSNKNISGLDLLDNQNDFYIAIPSQVDESLLENIIIQNTKGLSKAIVKNIIHKLDTVYIGMNKTQNKYSVQISADARIPKTLFDKMLTKKEGWKTDFYSPNQISLKYKTFSKDDLILSAPSSKITCISLGNTDKSLKMQNMLNLYSAELLQKEIITENNNESTSNLSLSTELKDFLSESKNEIRFYTENTGFLLSQLFDAKIDLKIIDVCGSFSQDSEDSNLYNFNLFFNFKNEKYLKAAKALLKLLFNLSNNDISNDTKTMLKVTNIKINKNQVYNLFKQ